MYNIAKLFKNFKLSSLKHFSNAKLLQAQQLETNIKPNLRLKSKRNIGPLGWFLLVIPTSTFALGTWQIQRKKWKENLMTDLQDRTNRQPVQLPKTYEEIEVLEYNPVHVRGTFLHDKEIYIGPRSLLLKGDSSTNSSFGQTQNQGYLVITPFKLSDRDQTILINRGWVPKKNIDPKIRQSGQVPGEVDVVGIVRLHENRPNFMPKNKHGSKVWYYRDLEEMCKITGADPVYLDATNDFDVAGGPVGGQTRVSLRNEHLSYVITWYSLCAVTSFMWYKQFIKPI